MGKSAVGLLLIGALLVGSAAGGWAQGSGSDEDQKKIYTGPVEQTFGRLSLVLDQGASARVQYQPDASRLVVETLAGEARVITSARYLVLVENLQGKMEVKLASGRVIVVEEGRSDIVGRAIMDDAGQIIIRLAGVGPFAQATGPLELRGSIGVVIVLDDLPNNPAASLRGVITVPHIAPRPVNPRPESSNCVSPSQPRGRAFGAGEGC